MEYKHIKIAAGLSHVDFGHIAEVAKQAADAGAEYIQSDAADMRNLRNMQLMGGHQVIKGIRPFVKVPIECHFYTEFIDEQFVNDIAIAGANLLTVPAEQFIGAPLAYLINYCRTRTMKIGLTIGCYTPLSLVEEAIYDIDRLNICTHGVDDTDGKDNWGWRRSVVDLVRRARLEIDKKNPKCELAIDGGLRADNLEPLIEHAPDVIVLSSAIFKHQEGIAAGMKECRNAIDTAVKKFNLRA